MRIKDLSAYQIFDSRGNPTVECELTLADGTRGRGLVPSGASTGQFEALELRDGDPARFRGRSVYKAIGNIHEAILSAVRDREFAAQQDLDEALCELDGTEDKSRLGANAILGVSMAFAAAAAAVQGRELHEYLGGGDLLPLPEIQILGGGAHAAWRIDVQDLMVVAIGARDYAEALEITFNVYHAAGDLCRERGILCGVADEGGYWPRFDTNEDALRFFVDAVVCAGYTPGREAGLSLDIAASDLFDAEAGVYRFRLEEATYTPGEFRALMTRWCRDYPVVSIEDPFADTDSESWRAFTAALGKELQIVGDDLFTTNPARIRRGMEERLANSVLIKLNQIGTVSETLEAIRLTQEGGWAPVVSARSGETEDAFIAHLAVGAAAGQLKVGSFARSERMAKWNEVMRIGRRLGPRARFAGTRALGRSSG
jgi:enolase